MGEQRRETARERGCYLGPAAPPLPPPPPSPTPNFEKKISLLLTFLLRDIVPDISDPRKKGSRGIVRRSLFAPEVRGWRAGGGIGASHDLRDNGTRSVAQVDEPFADTFHSSAA
jgi:hypothetical protein